MSNLSPLILPSQDYTFSGDGLAATPTVAFSQSANLRGRSDSQGAETIAWTATATVLAKGSLAAAPQIALTASSTLQATGTLQASETLSFTQSATFKSLIGSTSVGFAGSPTLNATGSLAGSESIGFTAFARSIDADPYSISPLLLPFQAYRFQPGEPKQRGTAEISFSVAATLTGVASFPSNLQASTSVADIFTFVAYLEGKGALAGATSIAFSTVATATQNKLSAAESVVFSETATATATGRLQGSTSVAVEQTGNITNTTRFVDGATSIGFSTTASLRGRASMQAATTIRFLNPGSLITPTTGSASFGITAVGRLTRGTTVAAFVPKELRVQYRRQQLRIREASRRLEIRHKARRIVIK